ncbi:MAG: Lrp/AsnC family transcriptional regulator [Oscillospiraceae bacterium]|nr:Lrp/AsnC family transcriptional regulator [Oscillospiraceae bacterium]
MDTLLGLLTQNARLSDKELAVMAGMTELEVGKKIKEYEKNGVIAGYSAIINCDLADKDMVTALIEVKVTPKADRGFDDIAETITAYEEVEGVTLISGAYDLAVTVCGKSYKEIALFVAQRLSTIEGVLSTATHFYLKRYKEKGLFIAGERVDERSFIAP